MSSPVRQMKQRRLPPLPYNEKKDASAKAYSTSQNYCQRINAFPTRNDHIAKVNRPISKDSRLIPLVERLEENSSVNFPPSPVSTGNNELNPELIIQYLNEHPNFLENYVLTHVNQERLQRWTAWKEQVRRQRNGENINGEIIPDRKTILSKWKASANSKKWTLHQELTRAIHNHSSKAQVLIELAKCIATATSADGYNLYLVDNTSQQIFYQEPSNNNNRNSSSSCIGTAKLSSTLAGYVIYTAETVRTGDILADDRFPDGLAVGGNLCQSVMGFPIIKGDGTLIGMIELFQKVGGGIFTIEDEEVAISMVMWADVCVEYVEMFNCMTKQRMLNEFLLKVTKSIFQDIVSMDTVIMKIMQLVLADRASLFLADNDRHELYARTFDVQINTDIIEEHNDFYYNRFQREIRLHVFLQNYAKKLVSADRASLFLVDTNTNELYARIFDTGKADENVPSKEIRFPMDKGVAGYVASTGEVLNIVDAYTDRRFNREVDMQTGYRTKTILCMPIYIRGSIIGVVQMVNKLSGTFTQSDEESFETFAIYCGLALHHAKLYEKIRRSEQKYRVALEVLSYHSQSSDEEFLSVKEQAIPERIRYITHYHFSPWAVTAMQKPLYVLYMFRDLFGNIIRFDMDCLIRFTLTVRKNYRNVPYHNWDHAFSVAHAMYTVVKTCKHQFKPEENAGHNIFKYLSSEEYKKMLSDIRNSILATDLALFFGNKAKLKDIADKEELSWQNDEHRGNVMALSMTACDLCAMYKPWNTQLDLVFVIMEEFWQQGDEEKAKGLTPMPMMDREKKHELPQLEVGFLVGICLPCYELMAQLFPEAKPMKDGALSNMKKWKQLAERPREDVERELCINSAERRHSLIQFGENNEDETHEGCNKDDDDVHKVHEDTVTDDDSTIPSEDNGGNSSKRPEYCKDGIKTLTKPVTENAKANS